MNISQTTSLPELVLTMAERVLGPITDEEKLHIMRCTVVKTSDFEDALH